MNASPLFPHDTSWEICAYWGSLGACPLCSRSCPSSGWTMTILALALALRCIMTPPLIVLRHLGTLARLFLEHFQ